jgi:hypothetical protein
MSTSNALSAISSLFQDVKTFIRRLRTTGCKSS